MIYYGFGITDKELGNLTMEQVNRLLDLAPEHKEAYKTMLVSMELDVDNVENYFDPNLLYYDNYGVLEQISDVLYEKYKIRTKVFTDNEGVGYLLFDVAFPWEYNKEEKSLTLNTLSDMINECVKVLVGKTIPVRFLECDTGT